MTDYSIFYKQSININNIEKELQVFDIFISAYNSSERIIDVFNRVRSHKKIWLIHPEYRYLPLDYPEGIRVCPESDKCDEISQVKRLLDEIGDLTENMNICIDCTGFMRHVLIFLILKLDSLNIKKFMILYSEPKFYSQQEDTVFTTSMKNNPRPLSGMYGMNTYGSQDYLVVGVGYDHKAIGMVASNKEGAILYPIFSFPSLSPDMYQQSAISSAKSSCALDSNWFNNRSYSPANDPFVTAEILSQVVQKIDNQDQKANIYISPLSTKIQAVGFTLYWLFEGKKRGGVSLLLPDCITYSRGTSTGLKKLWSYNIELV